MVPFIIGGIALAATGYGVKKFLENDDNREKVYEAVVRGYEHLDEFEKRGCEILDNLEQTVEAYFKSDEEQSKDIEQEELNYITHDIPQSEIQEYIEKFQHASHALYSSSLMDLQTALKEINNLEKNIHFPTIPPLDGKYNFINISDDIKTSFDDFTSILLNIKEYLDVNLDKLDEILLKENDYTFYNEEDKIFIQQLQQLQNTIDTATQSNMTVDGIHITREIKRAFKKLDTTLKTRNINVFEQA